MKWMVLCIAIFWLGGCSANVKAWEKAKLTKPSMQPDGGNALKSKFNEHIFVSKEGAKGGSGVSGGGCGCK